MVSESWLDWMPIQQRRTVDGNGYIVIYIGLIYMYIYIVLFNYYYLHNLLSNQES